MREESHLDDMRTAIRGDFERLERRRGSQELMVAPTSPSEPAEALDQPPVPGEQRRSWVARLLGR